MYGDEVDREALPQQLEVAFPFLVGTFEPKAVIGHADEVTACVRWLEDMRVSILGVGVLLLCSYFRVVVGRGKSVPVKVRAALVWCETHTRTPIGADMVAVKAFVVQLVIKLPSGKFAKAPSQPPRCLWIGWLRLSRW